MHFVITDKIKPAVRMTQRGKWVKKDAQEYLASKAAIGWQLKEQMQERGWTMLPERTPLRMSVVFVIPKRLHCADLDNQIKSLADSAQGIVFKDDRWIDEIRALRRGGDKYSTRLVIREANE